MTTKKIRVEVKDREWVEFNITFDQKNLVTDVQVKAQGCLPLIETAHAAAKAFKGKIVTDLSWDKVDHHWDQMVCEAISRLHGKYELPYKEEELCHCRKIPTSVVEKAILLGAHTPEKVKAWTSASSGCGTCKADVINLIEFRTKKKCQK